MICGSGSGGTDTASAAVVSSSCPVAAVDAAGNLEVVTTSEIIVADPPVEPAPVEPVPVEEIIP